MKTHHIVSILTTLRLEAESDAVKAILKEACAKLQEVDIEALPAVTKAWLEQFYRQSELGLVFDKVSAIKAYRELHGHPLTQAKIVIDHYCEQFQVGQRKFEVPAPTTPATLSQVLAENLRASLRA